MMSDAIAIAGTARFALPALVAGAVAIGFSPILVRWSELGPTATGFHRVFLALPVLGAWMYWQSRDKPRAARPAAARPSWRHVAALAVPGVLFAGDLFFWHWSIKFTTVANSTLLSNLAPIVVTLGAWLWLGERITLRFLAGLLASLAGAALLVGASLDLGRGYVLGDGFGIVTAVFYGAYILSMARLRGGISAATLMFWSSAVAAMALLPVAWLSGESVIATTANGWLTLVTLAWLTQAMGQGLIAWSLGHLPASFSSLTLLVQPVTAAGLGWLAFAESLGPWRLAGGAAVLAGVVLARTGQNTNRRGG